MSSRRGGLLLAGAFVTFAVSAALMHSYAVFLVAFLEEFRWSRAETSLAFSVSQLVGGASAPFVGALVDRLGPRRLVLLGGSILALGLLGSAYLHALWQLIVLYGILMTIGANCLGLVVFVPMLSRRFVNNRGMAISVVQSANGFARAVSAPVAQILISGIGWRSAYLAQGALMTVLVWPLAALFSRDDAPARVSSSSSSSSVATDRPARRDWTLAEAIATPHFWLLFTVYLCTGLGSFFVSLHQLAFAVDVGFDKLYAASVLGMGALLSVAGTIVTGTLSDHIGRELSAVLAYAVSIVGVICALFITGPDHAWLLWIHACFFGLTWGARGPAVTAKTADLFPGPNLGAILGVITVGTGIGSAVGAWGAGLIFDMSGSYRLAFVASIVSYLVGCAAFWALRRPPTRQVV
ncbi:MAG TPA: MFS transporter [Methylomirabilota bacterium]|nr:MFS transporter [Methylomirabilota bacterium]